MGYSQGGGQEHQRAGETGGNSQGFCGILLGKGAATLPPILPDNNHWAGHAQAQQPLGRAKNSSYGRKKGEVAICCTTMKCTAVHTAAHKYSPLHKYPNKNFLQKWHQAQDAGSHDSLCIRSKGSSSDPEIYTLKR